MKKYLLLLALVGFVGVAQAQTSAAIKAPESFTPNGDLKNDDFKPSFTNGIPANYIFMIFDADGQVVFRSKDPNEAWKGMNLASNVPAATGTYNWKVTYAENGQRQEANGTVELLR